VGVISPWNWPLQLLARSGAPALAVGNAVVVKPANDMPVTGGLLLTKILEEAGLPPGVLNVTGREISHAFLRHVGATERLRWIESHLHVDDLDRSMLADGQRRRLPPGPA
jgi:hypothetical protein